MKDTITMQLSSYYNQFIDPKDTLPVKGRQRTKNNNLDNIKIATKKLPPDFFRPFTRQNPKTLTQLQKQDGLKTPCFGDYRQSNSLSMISKQKIIIQSQRSRIITLPVQQHMLIQKQIRRNCTREQARRQQLDIHRLSNTKQLQRGEHHSSIERKKIQYKKKTLNDQLHIEDKRILNFDYENRAKLNIKKFFQEQPDAHFVQGVQAYQNLSLLNPNKTARRPIAQMEKLSPPELPKKLKVKKLPPIV